MPNTKHNGTPRPQVALIDAAIKHLQDAITELMRAKAAAERLYDERDIDEALDELDDCPQCGPACWRHIGDLFQDPSPAAAEPAEPGIKAGEALRPGFRLSAEHPLYSDEYAAWAARAEAGGAR